MPHASQVAHLLSRLAVTERASIDEVYLDVTQEATRRLNQQLATPRPPPEPESFDGIQVAGAEDAISADTSIGTVEAAVSGAESWAGIRAEVGAESTAEVKFGAETKAPSSSTSDRISASAAGLWWRRPASDWLRDPNERLLAAGASVVSELRADVLRDLGFTCSAGVAHHKILCKLGSGTCPMLTMHIGS